MESEFRERHVKWMTNTRIDRVEENRMFVTTVDDKGEEESSAELGI